LIAAARGPSTGSPKPQDRLTANGKSASSSSTSSRRRIRTSPPTGGQTILPGACGVSRRSLSSLQIPVIAVAQASRDVERRRSKRPRLSDLTESDAIESIADIVLFVHRPEYYDAEDEPGVAEIILAKNRDGPTGSIRLALLIFVILILIVIFIVIFISSSIGMRMKMRMQMKMKMKMRIKIKIKTGVLQSQPSPNWAIT
jgi:hypothetical protein